MGNRLFDLGSVPKPPPGLLRTLIWKEFVEKFLSFRFALTTVLSLALILISLVVLKGDYEVKQTDFVANKLAYKDQAQSEGSFSNLERTGLRIDKPPTKMQVSVYGLESVPERTATVKPHGWASFVQPSSINPVIPLFPVADLLYLVATVLSLLALVGSYDAVSGEGENGTLKLLLSYSVPKDTLIMAKWIGGYLTLAAPFLLSVLVGAIIIAFSPDVNFDVRDWTSFTLVVAVSMIFLASMFSMGLLASTVCKESSTAISLLIFAWVIFVLTVPNISPFIADALAPTESLTSIQNNIREETQHTRTSFYQQFWDRMRELRELQKKGDKAAYDAAKAEYDEWRNAQRAKMDKETDKIVNRGQSNFQRGQERQISVTQNLSRLSPIASYVYSATDIAGTGMQNQFKFLDKIQIFQQQIKNFFAAEIKQEQGRVDPFNPRNWQQKKKLDLSTMPTFRYDGIEMNRRAGNVLFDVSVLFTYTIFFFILSFMAFIRKELL